MKKKSGIRWQQYAGCTYGPVLNSPDSRARHSQADSQRILILVPSATHTKSKGMPSCHLVFPVPLNNGSLHHGYVNRKCKRSTQKAKLQLLVMAGRLLYQVPFVRMCRHCSTYHNWRPDGFASPDLGLCEWCTSMVALLVLKVHTLFVQSLASLMHWHHSHQVSASMSNKTDMFIRHRTWSIHGGGGKKRRGYFCCQARHRPQTP